MFRKHTLTAAALMMAAALQFPVAGADGLISTKQDVIPTSSVLSAVSNGINTTFQSPFATCEDCASTFAAISANVQSSNPTTFPQKTQLSASSGRQIPSTGDDYTTQSVLMQEQMMMNLLNQDRKNNGRTALTLDVELSRIARIKSADMRDNGYFAHESPTYGNVRAMLKHFGYPYAGAGENIAHHANVDKAQAAFMSSPGHRANILSKAWTKVGVGIVYDAQGYIYATQIFAR